MYYTIKSCTLLYSIVLNCNLLCYIVNYCNLLKYTIYYCTKLYIKYCTHMSLSYYHHAMTHLASPCLILFCYFNQLKLIYHGFKHPFQVNVSDLRANKNQSPLNMHIATWRRQNSGLCHLKIAQSTNSNKSFYVSYIIFSGVNEHFRKSRH